MSTVMPAGLAGEAVSRPSVIDRVECGHEPAR